SKLNSSGDFVWAKQMGGSDIAGDYSYGIFVDASGNVYTTGFFNGTVDFDPGAGISNLTAVSSDVFVSKLTSAGDFVWAKQISGPNGEQGEDIAVDENGNVFVMGTFYSTADFNPGAAVYTLNAVGGMYQDNFILKLN